MSHYDPLKTCRLTLGAQYCLGATPIMQKTAESMMVSQTLPCRSQSKNAEWLRAIFSERNTQLGPTNDYGYCRPEGALSEWPKLKFATTSLI